MTPLQRLACAHGIETTYVSEQGETRVIPPETLRRLLATLGVDADRAALPPTQELSGDEPQQPTRCWLPGWFSRERGWGFACQLYSLRSRRNWGIGDFGDLTALAEIAGALGADFIGLNPLHALFPQDPGRCSPYGPSSRRFLNPIYIAADLIPDFEAVSGYVDRRALAAARESPLVDYPAVHSLKYAVLETLFDIARSRHDRSWQEFEAYRHKLGHELERFALHEALAEHVSEEAGRPTTWPGWPEPLKDPTSTAVAQFASQHTDRITFHTWLQWVARRQLSAAQEAARANGLRIGLYTDLAVGVAGDGAMTWGAGDLVVADASIGAPPDAFQAEGQDWGLAPFSPRALTRCAMAPFREDLRANMEDAGAIRLDHAMALSRLYWIPEGAPASEGAYLRYPFSATLAAVAAESREARCLVIGEALGTVAPGFRETLAKAGVLAYQPLFFERRRDGQFRKPRGYARKALACVSTHDLPTLAGWWTGHDIGWRETAAQLCARTAERQRNDRVRDKLQIVRALREAGLWTAEVPQEMTAGLAAAVHRYVAQTPARLLSVQLEDALGEIEQPNLPGPSDVHHPNWRRKLPVAIEELADHSFLRTVVDAVREERRR